MMTLNDIFEAFWTIRKVTVTARENGKFLHSWLFGNDLFISMFMQHDIDSGKLTYINEEINAHGKPTRHGPENGWGVEKKFFPKDLLEAPVIHMSAQSMTDGHSLSVDVEMHKLTADCILGRTIE